MAEKGRTYYSKQVRGAKGNYDWPARFDYTDGYLGISQYEGDRVKERVLLSPAQVKALIEFSRAPVKKAA